LSRLPNDDEEDMNEHMRSSDTRNNTTPFCESQAKVLSETVLSYESTDATESDPKKLLENKNVGARNLILTDEDQNIGKVYDYNDSFNISKVSNTVMGDTYDVVKHSGSALKNLNTHPNDGNNNIKDRNNTLTNLPANKNSLLYETNTEYNATEPIDWLLDLWSASEHDSNIQPTKSNNNNINTQVALYPPWTSISVLPPYSQTLKKLNDIPSLFTSNFSKNYNETQSKKEPVWKTFNTTPSTNFSYQPNFSKFLNTQLKNEPYNYPCRNPCSLLNLPIYSTKNYTINSPLNNKDKCLDESWLSGMCYM
jgi:hypothetical protein